VHTAFFLWNEATVISFGQTSPLKKGVEGVFAILFYYKRERERERESEFTQGFGCKMGRVANNSE
jgi:hypothetical protein